MPGSIRYPDSLRQQAIALSRKGKGYMFAEYVKVTSGKVTAK